MKLRVQFLWDRLQSSLWLAPALMAGAALALSYATLAIDHRLAESGWHGAWWYGGGPEGARAVLSVVAGSMMTVAGVVFSIMMVVLSLAAQQYGPRLLRNFMRDRVTQFVLGAFVATFLYCLMVLRTIRGENHDQFVPQVSVTTGVVLALASLAVLIYFIHHVASSIQIGEIIAAVQRQLLSTIDKMFPESLGNDKRDATDDGSVKLPTHFESEAASIAAVTAGYVEAVEDDAIMNLAVDNDLVLRLRVRPGDFVLPEQTLMSAWPAHRVDDVVIKKLRTAVLMGRRTPLQDVLFALSQQTDIAVRALSPGINDPFTAMHCLDMLAEAFCRVLGRRLPSTERFDDESQLRIVARAVPFAEMIETSLGVIRQYARTSPTVTIKILEVAGALATWVRRPADRQALLDQVDAVASDAYSEIGQHDVARVRVAQEAAYRRLRDSSADHATT